MITIIISVVLLIFLFKNIRDRYEIKLTWKRIMNLIERMDQNDITASDRQQYIAELNDIARNISKDGIPESEAYEDSLPDVVDPFIQNIVDVIMNHMSDTEFNTEKLASYLDISVSQLTRKTIAAIGESPYRLIVRVRMEEAVKLMQDTGLNVSEIAYKCGYRELSNFSRAFHRYWNKSPKQMIKDIR